MFNRKTLLFCIIIGMVVIFQLNQVTVTTLKYFPIDDTAIFSTTSTSLIVEDSKKESSSLLWQIESHHHSESYLAHDVGLLYQNGTLKGIQTSWSQKDNQLSQNISLMPQLNNYYQAISYHYIELHQPDNIITSNYQMSTDQLFLVEDDKTLQHYFQLPKTSQEKQWAQALKDSTRNYLNENWTTLINYYEIDREQYVEIPLIDLYEYQDNMLPGISYKDSKRIIAQLWEGLYQNYIIPTKQMKENGGIMPLILLDKNLDHLMVLFTDGSFNNHKLIQKLSVN